MAWRSSRGGRARTLILAAAVLCGVLPVSAAATVCRPQLATGSEGPIDFGWHLRPQGDVAAVMLFVDYPNAAATESASTLAGSMVPGATAYWRTVSYGRLRLSVTPVPTWYRIPAPSTTYDTSTYGGQRALIAAAVAAADADVDFSQYAIVYIVSAVTPNLAISPTFTVAAGSGVAADGAEIRQAVTFGNDVRNVQPGYGAHVMAHETGHIFGLPDLYDFSRGGPFFDGLRFAGGWDIMSWVAPGAELLAWHRYLLGFLPTRSLVCVRKGKTVTATLAPLEGARGVRAMVAKTATGTAVVVEYRAARGLDAALCDHGVLVSTVRSRRLRPVIVAAVHPGRVDSQVVRCGPLYDAPRHVGQSLRTGRITVRVLRRVTGGLRVRVTYARPSSR
jgi:M6 family metalloprotease-like protein